MLKKKNIKTNTLTLKTLSKTANIYICIKTLQKKHRNSSILGIPSGELDLCHDNHVDSNVHCSIYG